MEILESASEFPDIQKVDPVGGDQNPKEELNSLSLTLMQENSGTETRVTAYSALCMFCCEIVTDQGKPPIVPENQRESSFTNFARLFKISRETLFQCRNFDLRALSNLQCSTCCSSIQNAVKMLDEIERLKANLHVIMDILQCNLVKSYETWRNRLGSPKKPEDRSVEFFQKTLIQCWSNCSVPLTSALTPNFGGRPLTRNQGGAITMLKLQEIEEDKDTSEISSENCEDDPDFQCDLHLSTPEVRKGALKPLKMRLKRRKRKIENEFQFKCKICGEGFHLKHYLNIHSRIHCNDESEERGSDIVNESGRAIRNYKKNRKLGWFRCRYCRQKFYSKDFKTPDEKFQTNDEIPVTFNSFTELRSHHFNNCLEKLPEDTYCEICKQDFGSEKLLGSHRSEFHENKEVLGNGKSKEREIISKTRYRKDKRLAFRCRHCQNKFYSKDFITNDGIFVTEAFPEMLFDNFSELKNHHLENCKEKSKEDTRCEMCEKDFASGKMLDDHRTIFHTKEFPFYCDKCGVGKISKSALNKHMLVHTDAKNFQCQICGQSFKRNVQLKFHMRRHNNEFPYLCDTCGKRFVNLQLLQTHETIHMEEKRFPCPICNKLFINKSYVRSHIYSFHQKSRKPRENSTSASVK